MTDRVSAYTVFLTKDVREDDAEAIAAALRMVKGRHACDTPQGGTRRRCDRDAGEARDRGSGDGGAPCEPVIAARPYNSHPFAAPADAARHILGALPHVARS
jgi:hypothetical protein